MNTNGSNKPPSWGDAEKEYYLYATLPEMKEDFQFQQRIIERIKSGKIVQDSDLQKSAVLPSVAVLKDMIKYSETLKNTCQNLLSPS
jgi:hypothetical protein